MSSKSNVSRRNHGSNKSSSPSCISPVRKYQSMTADIHPPHSHTQRKQDSSSSIRVTVAATGKDWSSSFSMRAPVPATGQASSSIPSGFKNTTPVPDSAVNSPSLNTTVSAASMHQQLDLLHLSAWIPSDQTRHSHFDTTQRNICQYHQTYVGLYNETFHPHQDISPPYTFQYRQAHASLENETTSSGAGLPPLERWLSEEADAGSVLAIHLGRRMRVHCTCTGVLYAVDEDALNATLFPLALKH